MEKVDVLIVGAGLAGLTAARALTQAGFTVQVLEKSRGVAGRAATKRLANGALADYGAPFFTVRNQPFRHFIEPLESQGLVQVWQHGMQTWQSGQIQNNDGHPRYSLAAGMTTLGKALRDENPRLEIIQNALVKTILEQHQVVLEDGQIYQARAILVNTPAPQALALTKAILEPLIRLALERVEFVPCWALIVALKEVPAVAWKSLRLEEHPILSWVSLEHTKRAGEPVLVAHAKPQWSVDHLEQDSQAVIGQLLVAIKELFARPLETAEIVAHRWRYAQATKPCPATFLAQKNLVFCGDWCAPDGNARIESAFESGLAAAGYLKNRLESAE